MRKSPMHSYERKTLRALLVAAASLNAITLFCQTTPAHATDSGPTHVYVTVSDKKNLPAPLPESSLAVSIDKHPVQVMSLEQADHENLAFAVLLDTSGSNWDHADGLRKAALEFFQDLSANNQEGYLITFNVIASATSKPISASQAQKMLAALRFSGGTALFEAIKATCNTRLARTANPSTPRRVILLLSDGDDNYSHTTLAQAENVAQQEGVSIFSLSIPSQESSPTAGYVLKQLAHATGGVNIIDKDLLRGAKSLVGAVNAQWELGLATPPYTTLQLHPLKITSFQEGVIVSAPSQIALP
jgi:Mg-chelatase subunit ChlD